jgi:hypothetical protein
MWQKNDAAYCVMYTSTRAALKRTQCGRWISLYVKVSEPEWLSEWRPLLLLTGNVTGSLIYSLFFRTWSKLKTWNQNNSHPLPFIKTRIFNYKAISLFTCLAKEPVANTTTTSTTITTTKNKKQTNSVAWVRERTILTEQPLLVDEVSANFCW